MMLDAGGGGGGGLIGGVAVGMKTIQKAGADGSFAISAEGGQALIDAFDEMTDWVNDNLGELRNLAQEPPLGTSNGANTVKPYVQNVASDQQGFLTMLLEFKDALVNGKQGVKAAMDNYQNIDQGSSQTFQ